MTTSEILSLEALNEDRIYLIRGPLFWKAYESSAYILCTQMFPLKVSKKFVKIANQELVSVGFPVSSEAKFTSGLKVISKTSDLLTLEAKQPIFIADFSAWKSSIPYVEDKPLDNISVQEDESGLREKILGINLATTTPLDAFDFLVTLQKELLLQK